MGGFLVIVLWIAIVVISSSAKRKKTGKNTPPQRGQQSTAQKAGNRTYPAPPVRAVPDTSLRRGDPTAAQLTQVLRNRAESMKMSNGNSRSDDAGCVGGSLTHTVHEGLFTPGSLEYSGEPEGLTRSGSLSYTGEQGSSVRSGSLEYTPVVEYEHEWRKTEETNTTKINPGAAPVTPGSVRIPRVKLTAANMQQAVLFSEILSRPVSMRGRNIRSRI